MSSNHSPQELAEERTRPVNYSTGKLQRSSSDKLLGGICAPIASMVKLDVSLIRVILVVLAFATSGVAVVVYLALWAILPTDEGGSTLLDSVIENGKAKYQDYQATKSTAQPSSQPGPAASNDTFNPYAED